MKKKKLNEGLFDFLFKGLMMYAAQKEADRDPNFDKWLKDHSGKLKQISDEMEKNMKDLRAYNVIHDPNARKEAEEWEKEKAKKRK